MFCFNRISFSASCYNPFKCTTNFGIVLIHPRHFTLIRLLLILTKSTKSSVSEDSKPYHADMMKQSFYFCQRSDYFSLVLYFSYLTTLLMIIFYQLNNPHAGLEPGLLAEVGVFKADEVLYGSQGLASVSNLFH